MRFIGNLLKLVLYLAALGACAFAVTAIWMSFDGLTDEGHHADVALVVGNAEVDTGETWPVLQERLDRVIKLYNDSDFPAIIVSGLPRDGGYDETDTMVKYLVSQGIPKNVIHPNSQAGDYRQLAKDVDEIMKSKGFGSVMIVGHYYQITRLKLVLGLQKIKTIVHDHTGHLKKADGYNIAREEYYFYDYLIRYYVMPQAQDLTKKLSEEAKTGLDKAKSDAEKAKDSVNHGLDNMSK